MQGAGNGGWCYASSRVGPALRCPIGGGGDRRSCAAAACSRRVVAPLKGLMWSGGTTMMAVLAGKGHGLLARRLVLEDSLGESLATATPMSAAFPVGGVMYLLYHCHPRVKALSSLDVRWWRHRCCDLPEGVVFWISSWLRCLLRCLLFSSWRLVDALWRVSL